MKKFKIIFTGSFFLLLSFVIHAQSKTGADYFEGKWNILVKGTPNGDSKMIIVLEKKDSTLKGVVQDTTGKEISKIDKIELTEMRTTLYFNAQSMM